MSNKFDELAQGLARVTQPQPLKRFGISLAATALAYSALLDIAAAADPTYTTVDFPGAIATLAVDLNDIGQIVGRYIDSAGVNHGYLLNNGIFTSITFPGASFTRAIGINANGDIVGSYFSTNNKGVAAEHGFLLRGGVFTTIDFPKAGATLASGINSSGDISGYYQDPTKDTRHGFILHAGTFSTILYPGATYTEAWKINDSGQIAGRYIGHDGNYHVYLFSAGSFTSFDYPGALETAPEGYSHDGGLNNLGEITSDYASDAPFNLLNGPNDAGHVHGFILNGGAFASLDFPAANTTLPFGINDDGQVVGVYADVNGSFHGFLRSP